ncbi:MULTISPECIES: hypothetical protein [Mycobacterium avium complex (MAC)]|uniref:hypothetical protein n=1 Tax=Mycobacterium avium complex (MAC) TaxID=120793 RepID=UPI000B355097|nr:MULTISPECIES: hypothetical protein [Mycobacterium avium complex (MAC)]UCN12829.1 hypothetical protein LFT50_28300 [Mycobacterium intracellulare subsp. chimaera]
MTTAPTETASTLAATLTDHGFRAEVLPADPPHTTVDAVNIWLDRSDRYPTDTIWEPNEDTGWEWGRNFEHTAPADITADALAQRVLATLTPRD